MVQYLLCLVGKQCLLRTQFPMKKEAFRSLFLIVSYSFYTLFFHHERTRRNALHSLLERPTPCLWAFEERIMLTLCIYSHFFRGPFLYSFSSLVSRHFNRLDFCSKAIIFLLAFFIVPFLPSRSLYLVKRFTMDENMDLISRARTGDRVSFGLLYDQHVHDVFHFLLAKTRKKEDAQDLTSITFMKALQNIESFSPKRNTSFRAWLFTIAYRCFLDDARSKKKDDLPLHAAEEPLAPQNSSHATEILLLSAQLEKALGSLSALQRETVLLRIWYDYSFREIAEILGKSEAGVKMHMKRALLVLKTIVPHELLLLFFTLLFL